MSTREPTMSRRHLFQLGAGLAAGAGALTALSSCRSGPVAGNAEITGFTVDLPAYIPQDIPTPDLPGTEEGVLNGYLRFPEQLVRTVDEPPLSSDVEVVTGTFTPLPPSRSDNPRWQAVEERLGGRVDFEIVPFSDYDTRMSTMVAGGNLPDLFTYSGSAIPNMPEFTDAVCEDLTDYLAGDQVAAYPNLANLPTICWRNCVIGNRMYGLPIPRGVTAGLGFYRHEMFAEVGVDDLAEVDSPDRMLELLEDLTRPSANQYGVVTSTGTILGMPIWGPLFGVPPTWRLEEDGSLVHQYETEEYREGLEFAVRVREAGCFYPGSEGLDAQQRKNSFNSGNAAIAYDGLPAYLGPGGYATQQAAISSDADPRPLHPLFSSSVVHENNVNFAYTLLRENEEDRIEELLRLANFLAAPFGSEEQTLLVHGVEDGDWERDDDGSPVATSEGERTAGVPWEFLTAGPQALFDPANPDAVERYHSALTDMVPVAVADPTVGLFSPAQAEKGTPIGQAAIDDLTSIAAGRESMDTYDRVVETWRSNGGDEIRAELEEALDA